MCKDSRRSNILRRQFNSRLLRTCAYHGVQTVDTFGSVNSIFLLKYILLGMYVTVSSIVV